MTSARSGIIDQLGAYSGIILDLISVRSADIRGGLQMLGIISL